MTKDETIAIAEANTSYENGADIVQILDSALSLKRSVEDPERVLGLPPKYDATVDDPERVLGLPPKYDATVDDELFEQSRSEIKDELWEHFTYLSDTKMTFLLETVQTMHAKDRIIENKQTFTTLTSSFEGFQQHVMRLIVNDMNAVQFPLRIHAMTFEGDGVVFNATPMAIEQLTKELRVQPKLTSRDNDGNVLYTFTFSAPISHDDINNRIDRTRYQWLGGHTGSRPVR